MIFFSFIGDVLELGGGLFVTYWLINDWRHGWKSVKSFADRAPALLENFNLDFFSGDTVKQAERRLKGSAQELDTTRRRVAQVQEIAETFRMKEKEFGQLVREAEECQNDAVRGGDDIGLQEATILRLSHEDKMRSYGHAAEEAEVNLPELLNHLRIVELQHQKQELIVEGIRLNSSLAEVTSHVYEIASDVGPEGYTNSGELERLHEESRRQRVQSSNLIKLLPKKGQAQLSALEDKAVTEAMAAARKRVAELPAPSQETEVEVIEDRHANGLAVEISQDTELEILHS